MRIARIGLIAIVAAACGAPAGFEARSCSQTGAAICFAVPVEAADTLVETVNGLMEGEAVVLGAGTFSLDSQLTIRASGATVWGQGPDSTILDFAAQAAQANGIDVIGDDLEVGWLTILDAKSDGLRVEDSVGVHLHDLRATWSAEESTDNGAYGLYPVGCQDVLLENNEAFNGSGAGIHLGQSERAIVRNNLARGNVAGIQIENSQFVDVYGNTAEDNTAGLLIVDLPANPIVGRDIRVYDNAVRNNNTRNFAAAGAAVARVPAGTGTFAMASRRVEIFANTYGDNDTMDLALVSGLVFSEGTIETWTLRKQDLLGVDPSDLPILQTAELVTNFQTVDVYVHGNTFAGGSGGDPDGSNELGQLFAFVYGDVDVDPILYDAIGEGSFSATSAQGNSNDNHICVGANGAGSFASLNLAVLGENPFGSSVDDLYRPAPPYAPFNCTSLLTGPIAPVELPFGE